MAPRVEENIWIELADGCRLAARMWFPDDDGPFAAVLEYIPYRIRDDNPLSAQARCLQSYDMGRDGWDVRIETDTSLRATAADFDLRGSLRASLNGKIVCEPEWHEKIPRDLL
jgi:predicted acyl esterase